MDKEKIAKKLRIVYIDKPFLFLDGWSFVHFISGIFLMSYFGNIAKVFILLIVWELTELGFQIKGSNLFGNEKIKDITWDMVYGLLGALWYVNIII